MSKKLSILDSLHSQDVDVEKRIIYVFGDIDKDMSERFVKNMHFLSKTEGDITIYFNTDGGDWDDGMAMYSAIRTCKHKVVGKVVGRCSSMGSIIIQACDLRIMDKDSYMLIHPGSTRLAGEVMTVLTNAKWEQETLDRMYEIYHERISKTVEDPISLGKLKKKFNRDVNVRAKECLEIGLVDEIEE